MYVRFSKSCVCVYVLDINHIKSVLRYEYLLCLQEIGYRLLVKYSFILFL